MPADIVNAAPLANRKTLAQGCRLTAAAGKGEVDFGSNTEI